MMLLWREAEIPADIFGPAKAMRCVDCRHKGQRDEVQQ